MLTTYLWSALVFHPYSNKYRKGSIKKKNILCYFILRSTAKNRTLRQYDYPTNKRCPKSLIVAVTDNRYNANTGSDLPLFCTMYFTLGSESELVVFFCY